MPVNSVQFWRTMWLFNNQTFLTCNMSQPFFSAIKMHQCHLTTFRTCSPLVLLPSSIIFTICFSSTTIQNSDSKVAFTIRFSFICIFYGGTHIWSYNCTIDLSGDTEKNPGLRSSSSQNSSICHWNLNSITEHSYVQISLLKAHLSIHKFHIRNLFVRNITRPQCSFTWCQFGKTGLWISPIRSNIKGLVYVSNSEIPFHWKY